LKNLKKRSYFLWERISWFTLCSRAGRY